VNSLTKRLLIAAALGAAMAASAPASAQVSLSIGIGGGPMYMGYDYWRPCEWYFAHDFPAPRRCYDYYRGGNWGPHLYISDGFVFRDRNHWRHWRGRDDFRRWRSHDWDRDRRDWDRKHRGWDRGDHDWRGGGHGGHGGGGHHGDHH
jgi:hypothetical protein